MSKKPLLCLLLLFACSGCIHRTPWRSLDQSDAAWVGAGARGDLQMRRGYIFVGIWPYFGLPPGDWPDQHRYTHPATGDEIDPVVLGERTEEFLRQRGSFDLQLLPSRRDEPRLVEAFNRWQRGEKVDRHLPLVTPFQMNMVCLDPVVIVQTEETSYYNESEGVMLRSSRELAGQPGTTRSGYETLPTLPGGAIPRTRFKAVGELKWFSPTLEYGPTPLDFADDGVARIPVPWGWLVVRRDEGIAEVTTTTDQETP